MEAYREGLLVAQAEGANTHHTEIGRLFSLPTWLAVVVLNTSSAAPWSQKWCSATWPTAWMSGSLATTKSEPQPKPMAFQPQRLIHTSVSCRVNEDKSDDNRYVEWCSLSLLSGR